MKWNIGDGLQSTKQQTTMPNGNSMGFMGNESLTFPSFLDEKAAIKGHNTMTTLTTTTTMTTTAAATGAVTTKPPKIDRHESMCSQNDKPFRNATMVVDVAGVAATIGNGNGGGRGDEQPHKFQSVASVWTTDSSAGGGSGRRPPSSGKRRKHQQKVTNGSYSTDPGNDFRYDLADDSHKSSQQNISTAKLMAADDQLSKQSKCSIFRGILLCLCLNMTYANVIRFPRELERHGSAFIVPYFILLFLIGLPNILLEVALGQFLGQGSAHAWRASPFFKGASVVGRLASWLAAVWTSMQAGLAFLYIGTLIFNTVPFKQCSKLTIVDETSYRAIGKSGQDCIKQTFLTPVWENTLYYGLLTMSLIVLWIITMACAHSSKIIRRMIMFFGLIGCGLLFFETGWEVGKSLSEQFFPEMWPFVKESFSESTIWFNALVQVIYSTNIGFGILPVITGKFLYKGDAFRTSIIYVIFNILITAVAVSYFMVQFSNPTTLNSTVYQVPELSPFTSIYDRALAIDDPLMSHLIPGIAYLMIIIASIISITIYIFTAARIFRRHPTIGLSILGACTSVAALVCPDLLISRILDTRIVGALAICALSFDIIGIIWVYGTKNIYTDLEFSIGRPIYRFWILLWSITPLILAGILTWWAVTYLESDLLVFYIPRWLPIVLSLAIIVLVACHSVCRQVDYNFMSMLQSATKPSTDWGPGDPLVRHAWKQWRSVCEDTGQKDYTLRRRGTKDYTNSIKRGQYPHGKYGTHNRNNASTPGSNSPNYSGSIYGDSAIEEDFSVDKYPAYRSHLSPTDSPSTGGRSARASSSSRDRRSIAEEIAPIKQRGKNDELHYNYGSKVEEPIEDGYMSRIEISPPDVSPGYKISLIRNPVARAQSTAKHRENGGPYMNGGGQTIASSYRAEPFPTTDDHICWRKFSVNSEEYSTEL